MNELVNEIGRRVAEACGEAYFVGGCVRDFLRGEPLKDVDLAVAGNTHEVGRALAKEYRGHVFWLHQEEEVVRVALPEHGGLQVDFVPLHGSLEEDLRARDLTLNALAVRASGGLTPEAEILDVTGGLEDLRQGIVRFVSSEAPEKDPLRTLRALRFRWKLDFQLEAATAQRVRECVPLLQRVSAERIRDELFQLLALDTAADALAECLALGMGRWLIGREVSGATAPENIRRVQQVIAGPEGELRELLEKEVTPPRRRREVLLWAAALRSWPEVEPSTAARYLALSNDERQIIVKALANVETTRELAGDWPVAGHLRLRLFQKAGVAGPDTVLLAGAADGWSAAYDELLVEALQRTLHPEAPLLTGQDVMRILHLKPGPRVGQLLQQLEEARSDGLLHTPEEAEVWLRNQA